jgi:transposase-like protein
MLEDAEPDILAFYEFQRGHWRKLRSTNPLERFNREVGRRNRTVRLLTQWGLRRNLTALREPGAPDELAERGVPIGSQVSATGP